MPGTLYVVATPIGNLEDVTLRALRVLREVSVIAAEDTRRTARLLQHYSISTRTTSLHEHNEHTRTPALVARLLAGESVALVSDAGTPLISDPGRQLVSAAHAAGIRVEPVPGASAVLAALSAAGLPGEGFLFVGFPPHRSNAKMEWFKALASEKRVVVLYEAPHRFLNTLRTITDVLGERQICVARELTKKHEELVVRPISAFIESPPPARGEFTIVIGSRQADPEVDLACLEAQVPRVFDEMTKNNQVSRRTAVQEVAKQLNLPANRVYRLLLDRDDSSE
ncbi:MAG: 16S rRNA (cytidine(1402)-2'-O)-methyltransferase [Acidobacteria bacterium]|nr:16S rRNA (cytidine(1402)-2'-O)-methyltransferase [Acidobacteriota bacterium]